MPVGHTFLVVQHVSHGRAAALVLQGQPIHRPGVILEQLGAQEKDRRTLSHPLLERVIEGRIIEILRLTNQDKVLTR